MYQKLPNCYPRFAKDTIIIAFAVGLHDEKPPCRGTIGCYHGPGSPWNWHSSFSHQYLDAWAFHLLAVKKILEHVRRLNQLLLAHKKGVKILDEERVLTEGMRGTELRALIIKTDNASIAEALSADGLEPLLAMFRQAKDRLKTALSSTPYQPAKMADDLMWVTASMSYLESLWGIMQVLRHEGVETLVWHVPREENAQACQLLGGEFGEREEELAVVEGKSQMIE